MEVAVLKKQIDVFISYRRSTGSQLASLLKVLLQLRGYKVSFLHTLRCLTIKSVPPPFRCLSMSIDCTRANSILRFSRTFKPLITSFSCSVRSHWTDVWTMTNATTGCTKKSRALCDSIRISYPFWIRSSRGRTIFGCRLTYEL